MSLDLPPAHDFLTFLSPMSSPRAGGLAAFLAAGSPQRVVDFGCGRAELLLRTLATTPNGVGTGLDCDEDALARGRVRAATLLLADRVTLVAGDARTTAGGGFDAALCIGASQIWGPPVEAAQPLDYTAALRALRSRVRRGARVVYGEAVWSRPPTPAAVAPLAGRLDEFVPLPELVELAVAAGFAVVDVGEASLEEWDAFESGFTARYAHWLAGHPQDHPDAAAVKELAARQRAGYLGGYRGVLGMAYLQLLAA